MLSSDDVDTWSKEGRLMEWLRQTPQSSWLSPLDNDEEMGWSLLHYAAMGDNADAIKALVAAGAELEKLSLDDEQTPLLVALEFKSLESIKALIEAGANMDFGDFKGDLMDHVVRTVGFHEDFSGLCHDVVDMAQVEAVACLLFRHGLRVKPVAYGLSDHLTQPPKVMVQWQDKWLRAVAHCRSITIALLCVKRAAAKKRVAKKRWQTQQSSLVCWDKFLLAYMARHVWALRFVWPTQ